MKNISIIERKFRLYADNKQFTNKAIADFVVFYNSLEDWQDFNEAVSWLDKETRVNMIEIKKFYDEGYINRLGHHNIQGISLSRDFTKDELTSLIDKTAIFDKLAIINGWIVDTNGVVYAAKNHAHFLTFLTLLGVDCSSYVRVTNAPIGNTKLNFSSAKDYITSDKPFLMTEPQVKALMNLKTISEIRHNDHPLPFEDYILDSMLGGFLVRNPLIEENLKVIEKATNGEIFGKFLLRKVEKYNKNRDLYSDDYGYELQI